jgi:transposase
LSLGDEPPGKPEASGAELEATTQQQDHNPSRREHQERAPRLPEHLPVVEQVLDPPEVSAAPQQWRCIGQEVSEQLDYEPAKFFRRRLVRRKFVKRGEAHLPPRIAPLPPVLQERCLAAPGLLAQIIVGKFCDHLPLYRQEQIFAQRHRVMLPRQTMARWLAMVAGWCAPVYREIRTGVMGGGYVQIDETPVRYLSPGNGRCLQGCLWTANRPGAGVFFDWQTSRAAACLDDLVPEEFRGTVQSDAYQAYATLCRQREGRITSAACWAHARRKFFEAQEQAPLRVRWLLRQMAQLYRIEEQLREAKAGPALRGAVRAAQSRPIVARIGKALEKFQSSRRYLPRSLMGKAIAYTLDQWKALGVFLEDGRVEIDNNLVENAIRPTAIGKKNWMFIGEAEAGQNTAILYTLVENCRRQRADPLAYFRALLTALPSMTNRQVPDWTPAAWAKKHRAFMSLTAFAS